jgi:hypothetical protein
MAANGASSSLPRIPAKVPSASFADIHHRALQKPVFVEVTP